MSTNAQALVEQIKALPENELREIMRGLGRLTGSVLPERSAQMRTIQRVRGMFAGSDLRQALLNERARG